MLHLPLPKVILPLLVYIYIHSYQLLTTHLSVRIQASCLNAFLWNTRVHSHSDTSHCLSVCHAHAHAHAHAHTHTHTHTRTHTFWLSWSVLTQRRTFEQSRSIFTHFVLSPCPLIRGEMYRGGKKEIKRVSKQRDKHFRLWFLLCPDWAKLFWMYSFRHSHNFSPPLTITVFVDQGKANPSIQGFKVLFVTYSNIQNIISSEM